VAHYAIELYQQLGGRVIAVSCWDQTDECSYTYRKRSGIALTELLSIADRFGGINKDKAKEKGYDLDVHLVRDKDIAERGSFAAKIDAITDSARKLPMKESQASN
jgi:glutamate dehydrogenase (NAD(P)+)